MTERNPPVWMQSGTYQASDDRMVTGLLFDRTITSSGTFTSVEGGVVPPSDQLKLTASGSSMAYTISDGIVVVPAAGSSPPGAYLCYNSGVFNGTLDVESSGNPRIDLIVARVQDQTTGGSVSQWNFQVVKGSPSPNPSTPAWTSNQVPIASVRVVPASLNGGVNKVTNANVTDLRNFVASSGGMHLNFGSSPLPAHSPGRLMYNVASKSLYVNNGTKYDVLYTYDEWMSFFAAYRPVSAGHGVNIQLSTRDTWTPTPNRVDTPAVAIAPIQRTGVITPSGLLKITVAAYGRVDTIDTAARVSAKILNDTTGVWGPSVGRGISFYGRGWSQESSTFMAEQLPKNTPLTVRLEFQRTDSAVGKAFFDNCYLLVEPVI